MSEVYLWNDTRPDLTGPAPTIEGEWIPALFGKTVFDEDASRGCAFYVSGWKGGGKVSHYTTEQTFAAGRYSVSLRLKVEDLEDGADRLFGIAFLSAPKGDPVASCIVSADMVQEDTGYQIYEFDYYQRKESQLYLKFLFTGRGNVIVDYVDVEPTIESFTEKMP